MNSRRETLRPIGGFFGLALSEVASISDSVWNTWTKGGKVVAARTARGAFAHLIAYLQPQRVWLPAYICREMASAVNPALLRFYPLDDQLSPDCSAIRDGVKTGDLVVAVNYFGSPPAASFRRLATERPDVEWLEDRAQALWTVGDPWGKWQLYSPRKLLGVPDGGLLVRHETVDGPEQITGPVDAAIAEPEIMRFEDERGSDNAAWYAAFRAREAALTAEALPSSRLTRSLLERIAIGPLVALRKRNHALISESLSSLAAWPAREDAGAPFGFVISVDDAGVLAARLAAERFFCARHWAILPSDADVFAGEHALSRRLLTLPCDHRYEECDIKRLVEAVARLI
jgi:hypothetical protein